MIKITGMLITGYNVNTVGPGLNAYVVYLFALVSSQLNCEFNK